jgi:5-methyltetrahydrofolate--homocysteine methyltransferase
MALIFPLVKEYHCQLVGLCLDETGIPSSVEQRLVSARKIIKEAEKFKIPPHKIYLDPLIYPISTSTQQGIMVIETLKKIKQDFPGVKTIVGLSNISYGLPGRKIINRAFLSMLLLTNLDAALIDPLDTELMAELKAGLALLNQDEFCLNYLQFFRQQIARKGG